MADIASLPQPVKNAGKIQVARPLKADDDVN